MQQRRILVIDDHLNVRQALRRLFEGAGYLVDEATDGRQALEMLRRGDCAYDLVICDYVLDGMNGGVVELFIRDEGPQLRGRVLMLTGLTEFHLPDRPHLIRKPWDNRDLLKRVKERIDGSG